MSIFSENLKHLPNVEHVERIELSDAQGPGHHVDTSTRHELL